MEVEQTMIRKGAKLAANAQTQYISKNATASSTMYLCNKQQSTCDKVEAIDRPPQAHFA